MLGILSNSKFEVGFFNLVFFVICCIIKENGGLSVVGMVVFRLLWI